MSKLIFASSVTLGLLFIFATGGAMAVLVFVGTVNLVFAISFTLVIGVLSWLVGPFFTDYISKWFYKLEFHTEEEIKSMHPEVWELIHAIVTENNFKFPKVGIIPDENPTAYTYGSGRWNSRLVMTKGIFTYLSTDEVKAVVAHEMGHIVNRDFIVMMIASLLLQILYEIYSALMRARGKRAGGAKLIGLGFYVLYIIGIYLVYYLSRTREYLADAYSATRVNPKYLASALVRIGYGILASADGKSSARLLNSTRHLGIVDVKNAKQVGATAALTNHDVRAISEVMAFDVLSPWAKLIQLNSTHPLTGNRLIALEKISQDQGKTDFPYDIDTAVAGTNVDRHKLYSLFFRDLLVLFSPFVLAILSFFFLPVAVLPVAFALGLILRALYKFPRSQAKESTILEQMRNPYASPMRGIPVQLSGNIIGRGQPGYIFSEDMMLQDSTGITFLNYTSAFAWLGNIFFALTKVKALMGSKVRATGWFFRSMGSSVNLKEIESAEMLKIRSYPMLWMLILPVLLIVWSGYLYTIAGVTGTGLEYVSAMESSSKVGWKDYSDEELGVSFSYPEDFVVTKENISVSPKFSSIIRVSYKGTALLTMQEQGYTVSIANVIAQRIADLERQYAANNIKWETSTKDKAPLIHYLYPISGDEGTRVDPIFYEIDDYGNNRMLVISLAYEALDPSVESDMKTIGGSLITGR